jgi:predicted dehydrogenase
VLRWGVLGVSHFATRKMIPALQRGRDMAVAAIASRERPKAEAAARELGIPRAYGSYDELLADPEIDAVYNPLPNHLHVPWSIRAAEAGKHVLCEKPIALDATEARALLAARARTGRLILEAAMVRVHPRWHAVRAALRDGRVGELRVMTSRFGYDLRWRDNVRYRPEMGGGALLDIGFYPVTMSRFCFEAEPVRVIATIERDPDSGVDRLSSAILEFPRGQSIFSCGMQLSPTQHASLLGTEGKIELPIPWTPPPDQPTRILVDRSPQLEAPQIEAVELPACNQYTILAEETARAIRDGGGGPVPLEDSVRNMAVLDALFRSAETGRWESPSTAAP